MKRLLLLLFCVTGAFRIEAGLGPETTLLVVNADSPLSLTLANQWMEMRRIPANHVVWLHHIPTLGTLSMADFRSRILRPVFDHMERQGIAGNIDTIVYSADFPYAVSLRREKKRYKKKGYRYVGKSASLTGLTFFANQVMADGIDYLAPVANHYFRRPIGFRPRPAQRLSKEELAQQEKAEKALDAKETEKAAGILRALVEKHSSHAYLRLLLAEALAVLGLQQEALQQLEALSRLGYGNSLALRNDKWLKSLHDTPRFREIIAEIEKRRTRFESPRGFRSRYHWNRALLPGASNLDRYYLSAVLGYTGPRGNSLPEIGHYLGRSAKSDGSHPKGTVYLMENGNVRSETRQPWFAETCALLQGIGHACEILTRGRNGEDGILPRRRRDIIGLAAGTKAFNWKRSGSRLLAGAFADSLTSYAGDFYSRKQTKLTEFLRHGAAGSSGAVSEPYSIAEKFPLPLVHYYYALGYALAEAWFQSVASPYHVILVGDPLAQPFAEPIGFRLETPDPGKPWSGTVELAVASEGGSPAVDRFELWVDGRPTATARPGEPLVWDTTTIADGHHEIQLVAVEAPPREGRTTRRYLVETSNHGLHISLASNRPATAYGTPFLLTGSAPPGSTISIRQGTRQLAQATATDGPWEVQLPSAPLGMGRIDLQAVATTAEGVEVRSRPLQLHVTEPASFLKRSSSGPWQKGLRAEMLVSSKDGASELRKILLKQLDGRQDRLLDKQTALEAVTLSGEFLTTRKGFYQLSIETRGEIEIGVDERTFRESAPRDSYGLIHVPLFLEKGWHRLEIRPSATGFRKLRAILAGQDPPAFLGGDLVRSRKWRVAP